MWNRYAYLNVLAALVLIASGCQGQPAPAPAPPQALTESDDSFPLPNATETPEPSTSGQPGDATAENEGASELDGPLQFDLTEEERSRQATEGPLREVDPGSIIDAVPKPLKSGAVGSLGGALFRGVIGAAGQEASAEETPDDSP